MLYGAAVLLLVAAFGLGINFVYKITEIVPAPGGSFTEGAIGQPTLINPVVGSGNDADRDLIALLFSGLEVLKEEYKISNDLRAYTVILKKDLKWSDGEPLTSDDVLFTIETIQDVNTKSPLQPAWLGVVAERLSEREIKFTLKSPYAFFESNLDELKVIPQHIFGNIPPENIRLSEYRLEPIGNGPFAFVKYDKRKDGFITTYYLKRNEYYAGEKTYIDTFQIKFFSDIQGLLKSFNRLEIQGFGGLPIEETSKLTVGFQYAKLNIPSYYAIFLNQGAHLGLKEKSVRDALNKAVDKDSLIEKVFKGQAGRVDGPILQYVEGFDQSIYQNAKFSIEEAQKLLDDSLWKLGDDGIREKLFGKTKVKLEFDLIVPQIKFFIDAANIIKEDWAKIGVKATIVSSSPSDINESVIKTRNYQMIMFGNILKSNPDIFSFWHSSERFYPGFNLAVYENKKVDALIESIRKDLNTETRIANLKKLQEIMLNDTPAIFLFSPKYIYVSSKNLKGFDKSLIETRSNRFDEVYKWHLKTRRVLSKS